MKRVFDIFVASLGILFCAPVLITIAVMLAILSPGPVIYRGLRVGMNGGRFQILKFRTMVVNAEAIGGSSTSDGDARITPFGKYLRRWKLDELPQLWNVLTGDMSLVGPRPQVVHDVEKYTAEEMPILSVRPGMTDWASIMFRNEGEILNGYSDPDQAYIDLIRPEKMRLQLKYVREQSFLQDLKILWLTCIALLGRKVDVS